MNTDPQFQQRLRATFRAEARDHFRAIEAGLFELEKVHDEDARQKIVETIFREAHTLKGAARLVGEHAAEAVCQELEGVFSSLKQQRRSPDAAQLEQLHDQVATLKAALGPDAEAPAAAEHAAGTIPATDDTRQTLVRVPAERLNALLLQAEEMLAVKMAGSRRTSHLQEIALRAETWRKRWAKLKPQLTAARRFVDQNRGSPAGRQLDDLLQFIEWDHEFMDELRGELSAAGRSAGQEQSWLAGLIDGVLDNTKEILMVPGSSLLEIFPTFVRDAARREGKEIELVLEGGNTAVDRRVLEEVREAVTHLVRNAIDHGIERPAERRAAGKPEKATLTIAIAEKSGGNVEISVSDDGAGLDPDRIRHAAIEQGFISRETTEASEAQVLALLFESGFSTSTAVTDLSGRGLGLAIVKEKVERLGGNVTVESRPGRGTTFRLMVPITLARFRGVFVTAAGRPYVIPSAYVREIVRAPEGGIRRVKNQETLEFEGEPIPSALLSDILRIAPAAEAASAQGGFVVVIGAGRGRLACRVDDIPFESEIIMKQLGGLLPRVRNLAGATITGAGQVVPVLNAGDLLRTGHDRSGRAPSNPALRQASARRKRRVLVTEDSITSRSLFKSILQGAGYDVKTAVDGIEALTALKFEPVDLVISDVQMPRMDGFELTQKIRSDPKLSTLPVILITSLASREDKERGVDAGANAYVVKSSFDQSDLLRTIERLLG